MVDADWWPERLDEYAHALRIRIKEDRDLRDCGMGDSFHLRTRD